MSRPRQHIVASDLPALLRSMAAALSEAREEVDNLNVYPVPDGDTGTNLHATVQSAVESVEALEAPHAADADLAMAAARGALRGAAGNSGVIFSQVVRAIAEHLAERAITSGRLAAVLERARALSYDAIAQPIAGTILTAMDAAAEAAEDCPDTSDLVTALARITDAVSEAVGATRDMLEANRRAGVVDAGARGFEVALDGVLAFLEGRTFRAVPPPPVRRTASEVVTRESGSLTFAYEVQYLLEASDDVAEPLRETLSSLGDSVVVVACGGLLNVHVHTNDVDAAVEAGAAHGEPSRVLVTAFEDQITGSDVMADGPDDPFEPDTDAAPPERGAVGYLAVVPGPGLAQLVRGMGAVAVDGTAGALPTVATVLNAVGSVEADQVVLLPGHPNVVPTMRQASDVSVAEGGRSLVVVDDAASVPTVLAVLAVASTDELDLDMLGDTARHVVSGEVVAAVRDADTPLGPVREGQWLGLVDGQVVVVTDDVVEATTAVATRAASDDAEIVTLIAGGETDEAERARVVEAVEQRLPSAEVEVVDGGQRPSRWIVGAE